MTTISISMRQTVTVPDGAVVEVSPSGETTGIRLGDGRLVKPWMTLELHDGRGNTSDLGCDELEALDIEVAEDLVRAITTN